MNQDTICAIATAQGGAIGSIRVSGADAIRITSHIFTPAKSGKTLADCKPYTLTFGKIHDGEEIIDEVLVSLFRAPHSYTGEDSTEITCHGSSYILQQVLQLLIKHGCRLAGPGEYTQRAFLNGKMDLSQAEAVADLIASSSAATHRLAMSQMRGGFSKELTELRNQLLHFTSLIELELDFSDHEELEFADRTELCRLADHIEGVISRLVHSFSVGNAIKNGVPVAIIGETNAGKSTLLNVLLNGMRDVFCQISITAQETRRKALVDSQHIMHHQYLSGRIATGTDTAIPSATCMQTTATSSVATTATASVATTATAATGIYTVTIIACTSPIAAISHRTVPSGCA